MRGDLRIHHHTGNTTPQHNTAPIRAMLSLTRLARSTISASAAATTAAPSCNVRIASGAHSITAAARGYSTENKSQFDGEMAVLYQKFFEQLR